MKLEGANYTTQGVIVNVSYEPGSLGISIPVPKAGVQVLVVITNCLINHIQGSESTNPGLRTSYLGTYTKLCGNLDGVGSGDDFVPTPQSVVYLYLLQAP